MCAFMIFSAPANYQNWESGGDRRESPSPPEFARHGIEQFLNVLLIFLDLVDVLLAMRPGQGTGPMAANGNGAASKCGHQWAPSLTLLEMFREIWRNGKAMTC